MMLTFHLAIPHTLTIFRGEWQKIEVSPAREASHDMMLTSSLTLPFHINIMFARGQITVGLPLVHKCARDSRGSRVSRLVQCV